jgi:hypothetical protein
VSRLARINPVKAGVTMIAILATAVSLSLGASFAFAHGTSQATSTPCSKGGVSCLRIGYTNAWLGGKTVKLEYSHRFFCKAPPTSGAPSKCEVGAKDTKDPTSGAIVSPLRVLVPLGFTPSASTLQCPTAGRCIDHPSRIDLSRLFGSSTANAALPPHSHILVDKEHFQSTWWPVRIVGVKTQAAWNTLVAGKSEAAVKACQAATHCTADVPTNLYLFFQVLAPGSVLK